MSKSYHRPSILQKRDNRQKSVKNKHQSYEKFSSYESMHHSEHELQELSDYESSKDEKYYRAKGNKSPKQQKNNILIQQMPLKYENDQSSLKKSKKSSHNGSYKSNQQQNIGLKQRKYTEESAFKNIQSQDNHPLKYNYLKKIEKELSIIREDAKQQLKTSSFNVKYPIHAKYNYPVHAFKAVNDLYHLQSGYNDRIQIQSLRIRIEQQKVQLICLQEQNFMLKQRAIHLQIELKSKVYEKNKFQAERYAPKVASNRFLEEKTLQREETKKKLLSEINNLQFKCEEMRNQMKLYKQKQNQLFQKLNKQRQQESRYLAKHKIKNDFQPKFIEVFLNMLYKLPIELQKEWTTKKKIAVGWKIVKYLIKKSLKLGIRPPIIEGLTKGK